MLDKRINQLRRSILAMKSKTFFYFFFNQCLVLMPLSGADGFLQAAYAMLKCEELYATRCWSGSLLTAVQRKWVQKYPLVTSG